MSTCSFMNSVRHSTTRKQAGAAMLEFALVLPLLTVLLFGFIEVGRLLYQENTLTKAVLSGARFIARHPDALTTACAPGTAWAGAAAQAAQFVAFTQNGAARLPGLDASAISFNVRAEMVAGRHACVIEAEARTGFDALLGATLVPFANLGPIELIAQAEERYIGD